MNTGLIQAEEYRPQVSKHTQPEPKCHGNGTAGESRDILPSVNTQSAYVCVFSGLWHVQLACSVHEYVFYDILALCCVNGAVTKSISIRRFSSALGPRRLNSIF